MEELMMLAKKTNEKKVELSKIANTMAGASKIMSEYAAQFGRKAINLTNAISEMARIYALREMKA